MAFWNTAIIFFHLFCLLKMFVKGQVELKWTQCMRQQKIIKKSIKINNIAIFKINYNINKQQEKSKYLFAWSPVFLVKPAHFIMGINFASLQGKLQSKVLKYFPKKNAYMFSFLVLAELLQLNCNTHVLFPARDYKLLRPKTLVLAHREVGSNSNSTLFWCLEQVT